MPEPFPKQGVLIWTVILTILDVIAFVCTAYRLARRRRVHRWWWDDTFAMIAFFFQLVYFVAFWIRSIAWLRDFTTPKLRVVTYFMGVSCFFTVVWVTRISMMLSLTRLFPPGVSHYIWTRRLAISFVMIWTLLLLQTYLICGVDISWQHSRAGNATGQCVYASRVNNLAWFTALAGDVFGDLALVLTPLYMLWNVHLPKNPRRLVFTVFCGSLLTLAASVFCHYELMKGGSWEGRVLWSMMAAHLESGVSLFVCNLLVITTIYYRVFRKGEDLEDTELSTVQPAGPGRAIARSRVIEDLTRTRIILTEIGDWMLPTFTDSHFSSTYQPTHDPSTSLNRSGGDSATVQASTKQRPAQLDVEEGSEHMASSESSLYPEHKMPSSSKDAGSSC